MDSPISILTAELDQDSFGWLDQLRRDHFPPERNVLSAHLTLFHRLTSGQVENLGRLNLPGSPLPLRFDDIIFLGFGVAVRVASAELVQLRRDAMTVMGGAFSRQDSQRWSPHVTIQNKVHPDAARALHRSLADGFAGRSGTATGLLLWDYLGGPWRLTRRLGFEGQNSS